MKKGYYLVFYGNRWGKMFDSFEAAKHYAEAFNSIGSFSVPYTITEV